MISYFYTALLESQCLARSATMLMKVSHTVDEIGFRIIVQEDTVYT